MLKTNIDFLRKFDSSLIQSLEKVDTIVEDIEVTTSKSGFPSLKVIQEGSQLFLHSKYDPHQEAEKIITHLGDIDDYDHVLFFGIGLGYHVEELLKRCPMKKFSIIEPSLSVFKQFMNQKDMTNLPIQQLTFLKVDLSAEETKSFIVEFFNFVQEKTLLVTLPSYERFIPVQYRAFIQDFKKILEDKRDGISINYSFQKRWTLNSWINLPETIRTPNILHDIDRKHFENKPVLLIAAGPSLNEELKNIKYIKENGLAYLFTVGSAINTLIENDVYPDAMCTYDPTVINQRVFDKVVKKGINSIPMIYGTSVGFETLKNYKGPKLHMLTSQDTISNYYLKLHDEKDISKMNDAPSIAVVTLQLLFNLKCSPIILVGQNFAYKNNQRYAEGMGYSHVSTNLSKEQLYSALKTESVDGEEILTNDIFNRMRSQMEYYLRNYSNGIEVINTTKGGAKIEGTIFSDLRELINDRLKTNQVVEEWNKVQDYGYNLQFTEEKSQLMIEQFNELNHLFRKVKRTLDKMEQLILERKITKLEKMFTKFDIEMKEFVQNEFFISFLQPMSRVEFEFLKNEIDALKFNYDVISKMKKVVKSFKLLVNSCEFDIKNLEPIFEEVNLEIQKLLRDEE